MLVYPYQPEKGKPVINTDNLQVPNSLKHLFAHLKENGYLVDLEGYDEEVLQIFSPKVIQMIKTNEHGWEDLVPGNVANIIKEKCLFDYPCDVPELK
jgi:cobalamin biosynthesis Mg chelatase CobN